MWLLPSSRSCSLTLSANYFCEDRTISNTLTSLVGYIACWARKLSCIKYINLYSSIPVLCSVFRCRSICPWLQSPIIIQSALLTSLKLLFILLAISLTDGSGYWTLGPICSVILALRVDIVRLGAYSIPVFTVIECLSVCVCLCVCPWFWH